MFEKVSKLLVILLCAMALASCDGGPSAAGRGGNGIYYWRTTFDLSDAENEFLKKNDVGKLYVRFFDVDKVWNSADGEEIVPIATLQFKDSLPAGVEIVPVVYITVQAMEAMQIKEGEYAEKIVKRVKAMCRRQGVAFKEIQLDCDWTRSTRKYFFRLCEEIKQRLGSDQCLSSTIRLHQLTQDPPPVDMGVLMVYNTGSLMEMTTDNSIFSRKDIEPYLKDDRLAKYSLPLDVAYPAYGWSIEFRPGDDKYRFSRILRQTDFSSFPGLKSIGENIFEAVESVSLDSGEVVPKGSRIRVERPAAREIIEVKKMIERQLKGRPHSTILYHLDESQLSHYSKNELNKIYSCD